MSDEAVAEAASVVEVVAETASVADEVVAKVASVADEVVAEGPWRTRLWSKQRPWRTRSWPGRRQWLTTLVVAEAVSVADNVVAEAVYVADEAMAEAATMMMIAIAIKTIVILKYLGLKDGRLRSPRRRRRCDGRQRTRWPKRWLPWQRKCGTSSWSGRRVLRRMLIWRAAALPSAPRLARKTLLLSI